MLIRVEGPSPSVDHRSRQIIGLTERQTGYLEAAESAAVWAAVRELEPLVTEAGERLWRISLAPSVSADFKARLFSMSSTATPRALFDWGGGLLWCALPESVAAEQVHRMAQDAGGYARLVRSAVGHTAGQTNGHDGEDQVFPPLAAANRKIHQQLKLAFDPSGVLNPGRMYAGL